MTSLWGARVHVNPRMAKRGAQFPYRRKHRDQFVFERQPDNSPSCVVTKLFEFDALEKFLNKDALKVDMKEEICIQYAFQKSFTTFVLFPTVFGMFSARGFVVTLQKPGVIESVEVIAPPPIALFEPGVRFSRNQFGTLTDAWFLDLDGEGHYIAYDFARRQWRQNVLVKQVIGMPEIHSPLTLLNHEQILVPYIRQSDDQKSSEFYLYGVESNMTG